MLLSLQLADQGSLCPVIQEVANIAVLQVGEDDVAVEGLLEVGGLISCNWRRATALAVLQSGASEGR